MTSTDNQPETILRTNIEAAEETARQLVLRDIGGVIVVDFIDMDNPRDQQIVWQRLSDALQHDKSQPQISYFSEFGLVEMTRRRQRQRLSEMLTMPCPTCQGVGRIRNLLYRSDLLSGDGIKVRVPMLQVEEKTSRYRSGVEKSNGSIPAPASAPASAPVPSGGGRSRGGSGKSRQQSVSVPQVQSVRPMPVTEPDYRDEPDLEIKAKPVAASRAQAEEKPEDLLFDASIFNTLTDEVLESYIEREDSLNVSGRLAGSLDELLGRIESDGLSSIKRAHEGRDDLGHADDDEAADEVAGQQVGHETHGVPDASAYSLDDYISEEGDEEDEPQLVAELAEEEPAPVSRGRGRRPAVRKRQADVADEEEAVTVLDQAASQPDLDAAEDEEVDFQAGEDEGLVISPVSLAESALTANASALNQAKPAKRILTKRRTIRSFRPKR